MKIYCCDSHLYGVGVLGFNKVITNWELTPG
jgi:hypothetical protein